MVEAVDFSPDTHGPPPFMHSEIPQFSFRLCGPQASGSLYVAQWDHDFNGASEAQNPKMRNRIHSACKQSNPVLFIIDKGSQGQDFSDVYSKPDSPRVTASLPFSM